MTHLLEISDQDFKAAICKTHQVMVNTVEMSGELKNVGNIDK